MNLSPTERVLLILVAVCAAYRYARGEWPLAVEVTPTEGDA